MKKGLTEDQLNADKGPKVYGSGGKDSREFRMEVAEVVEMNERRKNLMVMGVPEEMKEEEMNQFLGDMMEKLADKD